VLAHCVPFLSLFSLLLYFFNKQPKHFLGLLHFLKEEMWLLFVGSIHPEDKNFWEPWSFEFFL
jgi:hypothetical protein